MHLSEHTGLDNMQPENLPSLKRLINERKHSSPHLKKLIIANKNSKKYIYHILCTKDCFKYFTYINFLNLHNQTTILIINCDMETLNYVPSLQVEESGFKPCLVTGSVLSTTVHTSPPVFLLSSPCLFLFHVSVLISVFLFSSPSFAFGNLTWGGGESTISKYDTVSAIIEAGIESITGTQRNATWGRYKCYRKEVTLE